jgi:hypothetical protein
VTSSTSERPSGSPARNGRAVQSTVFGLEVRSEAPLSFLEGAATTPVGRTLELSVHDGDTTKLDWPRSAELVCDERQPDGSVIFQIEAHAEAGYKISGPEYGTHLLSAAGRRLLCVPEGRPHDAWQRLLIAQVLPFAALLQGLEVFHAGAVVCEGQATAFLGPSGIGKTSVALELCRRGASFLTDDVLALETGAEKPLAHPGTPLAGLAHAEARRLDQAGVGQRRGEIVAVNDRERLVRMRPAEPAPLGALFFLDRRSDGPSRPRFESAADAQTLLSATFNSVLTGPERLRGLLDVCALVARHRVERIFVGPDVSAAQLATAVQERLGLPA